MTGTPLYHGLALLAQASLPQDDPSGQGDSLQHLQTEAYDVLSLVSLEMGFVILGVGLIALAYGWRVYRVLVMLAGALTGYVLGYTIGTQTATEASSGNYPLIMAVVGACVFGFLALPYLRFALFMLAGVCGAFVTYLAGLEIAPEYRLYFAGGGFLLCGIVSMAFFEVVIVLGTAVFGAAAIVTGIMVLLGHWAETSLMIPLLTDYVVALPIVALGLAGLGFAIQMQLLPEEGIEKPTTKKKKKTEKGEDGADASADAPDDDTNDG